ncbi:hypothetical protein [Pyrodictium delaneyi]|uniref:Uncharacterized protein n=1 Tax=Pyrodictium delaneyi TaxID=1273541 RepID=A0A211YLJ5_9CREN|nr:hypothetical protein [Pyrodictium delaneyi]OWJ53836.1 hypothetical protein Pdsh_10395 [Pyrodictium delaneyi]
MRLESHHVLVVLFLAMYSVVFYYLGLWIGSGFSIDIVERPIPEPQRLAFDDYAFSRFHVAMRVWGLAYNQTFVDASKEPVTLHGYHFTSGLECSRVKGTEDVYECTGSGYVYTPQGFREDCVPRGGVTANYYAGWVRILLYSVHQAVATVLVAAAASGLAVYVLAHLSLNARLHALTAAVGSLSLLIGGLRGLGTVPRGVPGLYEALQPLVPLAAVASLAVYTFTYALLRRRMRNR